MSLPTHNTIATIQVVEDLKTFSTHRVRPDMQYCLRFGRFCPNPRMKHISDPPRHMTKSYVSDFNMISQHYSYKDTTSHTIGIQLPKYITTAEDMSEYKLQSNA